MQSQSQFSDELMTYREVAQLCRMGVRSVARKVSSGDMPAPLRIGNGDTVRFSKAALLQWIADGCPKCGAKGGDDEQ